VKIKDVEIAYFSHLAGYDYAKEITEHIKGKI